jgi:hypothetical protein
MKLQDHQVEIWQYARDLEKEIESLSSAIEESDEPQDIYEWINEQLSLTIWRANDGLLCTGWKAELLLSFGGPNVSIELDSRWEYGTLHHSWGAKASGEAETSTEFHSLALHEAINEYAEMGAE